MRGAVACACLVVAACSFDPPHSNGGGGGDGPGSAGQTCFNRETAFSFCVDTPTKELVLSSPPFYDTGTSPNQDGCASPGVYAMVGSSEACVLAGTSVTIAAGSGF